MHLQSTHGRYKNNGAQNFTEHIVAVSEYAARHVAIADIDGDGDNDIATVAGDR